MVIHVVKAGDTIFNIARSYGVSASRIIEDNAISDPDRLIIGQTLVILYPAQSYTVEQGDTLDGIAQIFGTSVNTLLRNNPQLGGVPTIYAGQSIVINYTDDEKLGRYIVNGYAYPFINDTTLRRTLPYLSYLTLFGYGFTVEGELVPINDEPLIAEANRYGVGPVLLLSTISDEGTFNSARSTALVSNPALRELVVDRLLSVMDERGYVGIDVDFEYIPASDRDNFSDFIRYLSERMHARGYFVVVCLAPKTSDDQPGLLYEGLDYAAIGSYADLVLLMTYEYGYKYGPPMAVSPIDSVERVLQYAVERIPPDKILMGVPNYGYDWPLPYVRGTTEARTLGNVEAVELAGDVNAEIQYDERSQSPFYTYYADNVEHIVWFEDSRSIDAKLRLCARYNLAGVSYWNIMKYFPQNWLVLNSLFDIERERF